MKLPIFLTIIASSSVLALPGILGQPRDGNDGCGAQCQAIKGGFGLGVSSPTCSGLTGDYCSNNCECSANGIMECKNNNGLKILSSDFKCSDDAVTKICVQGLKNQWECWCQNLFVSGWGPGENAGETCGDLFGRI
ncbi:hypothetical protein PV04_03771 [Phialophora macrospora]|uniref:Extracellular membrane protein CFEM domain-containing protein n=1 Tax=Phialophora macrospora TaxID=1851006 RepID=A0A0D2GH95_9EURO|nr:hypothetical protein PV04_03771 [Phialophora macrospora]